MELTFVGVGNAFAPGGLLWSSFLVDGRLLFEAPPSILPALKRNAVDLQGIDTIVLSHFHGDHFAGLPFLFLEYAYLTERREDLLILGPPGVEDRIERLTDVLFEGIAGGKNYRRIYRELSDGASVETGSGRLLARRVQHAPDLEAFGFRLEAAGKTLAYSGDSTYCPQLRELGDGADAFVVEFSGPEENEVHMHMPMLQRLRQELGEAPRMILTHRQPDARADGLTNAVIAEEGGRYSV